MVLSSRTHRGGGRLRGRRGAAPRPAAPSGRGGGGGPRQGRGGACGGRGRAPFLSPRRRRRRRWRCPGSATTTAWSELGTEGCLRRWARSWVGLGRESGNALVWLGPDLLLTGVGLQIRLKSEQSALN